MVYDIYSFDYKRQPKSDPPATEFLSNAKSYIDQLAESIDLISGNEVPVCESQTLELKSANEGCPKRLYDSFSSFSNQDAGGTILFGVEEKEDFAFVGVHDPQDLMTSAIKWNHLRESPSIMYHCAVLSH